MRELKNVITMILFLIMLTLFYFGNFDTVSLSYAMVYLIMLLRTFKKEESKKYKLYSLIFFAMLLTLQILFVYYIMFNSKVEINYNLARFIGVVLLLLPFITESLLVITKYTKNYPSILKENTMSFEDIKSKASKENIKKLAEELPKHSATKYINKGTLNDKFFEIANKNLTDPNVYIIISDTGSPASEIISIFTRKNYNHVSISFDKDLKTIVSYNGGENLYPPGLNEEQLKDLNQKKDAKILVYKLKITKGQKKKMINRVREIDETGSAYNMLGLAFKISLKPNIMFCSQFVYTLLKFAEAEYFKKSPTLVKPTDFIEMDYKRKLEFAYEINFNKK